MRRLQIGMWGKPDPDFWAAYGSEAITGIEASQYESEREVAALAAFCKERGLVFGIHAPVLAGGEYPKVTSVNREEREAGIAMIRNEVRMAACYGPDYILFHYPYPSIMATVQDADFWSKPAFEHYESAEIDPAVFREASIRLFAELTAMQREFGQKIVLEYDFFGDYGDLFVEMFRLHPEIQLVADVQRIDVQKRAFPEFDPYLWLDLVAPHVYLAHYSNTRYGEDRWERHLPVLAHQIDDPAYGDAYAYLRYLAERNDKFHVTFEHNPALVAREELLSCYSLVEALLQGAVQKPII